MTFYETLAEATQEQRTALYSAPQLAAALKGEISRDTYIAYLTQAYQHVKHTVPFLMSMGGRLPEKNAWLRPVLADYISEELGHEEWILNDIEAAGGNRDAAQHAQPYLATELLVAYNYDYIARKNPVGFLGMVFMLESTSVGIATAGADSVKAALNLPKGAFSYLYSHGTLDASHLDFFKTNVNRITDTVDQASIIEVAQKTFQLFAQVIVVGTGVQAFDFLLRAVARGEHEHRHHAALGAELV